MRSSRGARLEAPRSGSAAADIPVRLAARRDLSPLPGAKQRLYQNDFRRLALAIVRERYADGGLTKPCAAQYPRALRYAGGFATAGRPTPTAH
jgi:hypothetical protein